MSIKKSNNHPHAFNRCKERFGLNKTNAKSMIRNAYLYGVAVSNLPEGKLKEYLKKRENNKRIKVYKNKVFIFSKNSTGCITVYAVPDELLQEEEEDNAK